MACSPAPTDSPALRMEGVQAEFGARSREFGFDPSREGTLNGLAVAERARQPRSKRVVVFVGAQACLALVGDLR